VTLTTVGYGDISPQSAFVQALANVEAILGQIYLTVLVARLVGIQVAQGMSAARADRCDRPGRGGDDFAQQERTRFQEKDRVS
jgi:hypothetical protein